MTKPDTGGWGEGRRARTTITHRKNGCVHRVLVEYTGGSRKRYAVYFDEAGEIVSIAAIVRRALDLGSWEREFWHQRGDRPLTELGKIVSQSARAKFTDTKLGGVQ